jgi:hypothetical protein
MILTREIAEEWQNTLKKTNGRACTFEHHQDEQDRPLCPPEVRRNSLGCAHGFETLLQIIVAMKTYNVLGTEQSEQLRQRVNHREELGTLDRVVAHCSDEALVSQAGERQGEIIHARQHVVAELLAVTGDVLANMPQTTRLTSLPLT